MASLAGSEEGLYRHLDAGGNNRNRPVQDKNDCDLLVTKL